MTAAITFGNVAVATAADLTKHISLYSTTYGFSITGSRLNIVSGSAIVLGNGTLDYLNVQNGVATLTASAGYASMVVSKGASGQGSQILGQTALKTRWALLLGNAAAEGAAGSNIGSDFALDRWSDAVTPAYIDTPLTVSRATGIVGMIDGATTTAPTAGDSSTRVPTTAFVATALALKEGTIAGGTTAQYWRGDKSWQTLDKAAVGLNLVDNTADASKPVSTAQAAADALKANIASPTFTGIPAAPTAGLGTNTTQLATTAFVLANAATNPATLPYMVQGVADGTTDLDTIQTAGWFGSLLGPSNAHIPIAGHYFYVQTLVYANGAVTQMAYPYGTPATQLLGPYWRGLYSGAWCAWVNAATMSDLALKLNLTGGTLSGGLTINTGAGQSAASLISTGSHATLQMSSPSGFYNYIDGRRQPSNLMRWRMILGEATADPNDGSNAGSHFVLQSYKDDGATGLQTLSINRTTGLLTYSGGSSQFSPAGQVAFFAMAAAPSGWLKANGALVSRTTYAVLFTAIGTVYGVGDGTTTFALPDLRGEFVRGLDDGRGVDVSRVLNGTSQVDSIENHTHTFSGSALGTHDHGLTVGANSVGHTHTFADNSSATGNGSANHVHTITGQIAGAVGFGFGSGNAALSTTNPSTSSVGATHTHTVAVAGTSAGISANHVHTIDITVVSAGTPAGTISNNVGGLAETRPRNIALLACIKY
jgi:microcystin-dependent protein